MRKRNRILLVIICILSLCVLAGLIALAFDRKFNMEIDNKKTSQKEEPDSNNITPAVSAAPSPQQGSQSKDSKGADAAGPAESYNKPLSPSPTPQAEPIVLSFAGDVNLDEASTPVKKYDSEKKDITKCLSEDLLQEMLDADIMMLNNEFAFSSRGSKTANKKYTFRAKPDRVEILKKMGVDIVSLANNHALDYGQDALTDTFSVLDDAGIDYVGAGTDLDRAESPVYYNINGKRIAYLAASRVIFDVDWYATDDRPGMLGTYDPAIFLECIKEARANSDYVIVFVHWGIERKNYPEKYQKSLAKQYIDAGADAVIGCHPHVMQGFEFYNGKLIAYSLSNFWFSRASVESALLKLYIDNEGQIKPRLLPVMSKNNYTYLITDKEEKDDYYDFIKKISYNVEIDDNGIITPKE